ncbi:DedA family protein [bacterium]|nr:DedA family protein [bacterium]
MERLFAYLTDLSGGVAYLLIFGILVACGLGFPLPEDIPLIATGYLIWDGTMTWVWGILVTMLGVLIGDSLLFWIGHRLGGGILNRRKKPLFSPKRVRRARAYFRKYGAKVVFFARFVAGLRAVVFFMAGSMHMKFRTFILLDFLAALVSVPLWIAGGYYLGHYFGSEISELLLKLKEIKMIVTVVISLLIVAVITRSLLQYRNTKRKARKAKA